MAIKLVGALERALAIKLSQEWATLPARPRQRLALVVRRGLLVRVVSAANAPGQRQNRVPRAANAASMFAKTTALAVPSVVVLMGAVTWPLRGAHQSTLPVSGLPVSNTETILAPVPVIGQPAAALSVANVTCVPSAVR